MSGKIHGSEQADAETAPASARRVFLKRASQVAVTTPAITLLLSAGVKSGARAGFMYACPEEGDDAGQTEPGTCDGPGADPGLGQDFEFGEDGDGPTSGLDMQ